MCDPGNVTVAVPCYNAADLIGDTLRSVEELDPPAGEILVVDDGSTDGSGAVAASFPRVRVIAHEENKGIAGARNTALDNAAGDIILFLDADTITPKDLLAKICSHYKGERVGGVGGQGLEVVQKSRYDRWRGEVLFQGWGSKVLEDVPFLFGLCSSYRKAALKGVGGFNPIFRSSGEDMDAGFRLRKAGYTLIYEPQAAVDHIRADTKESIERMVYRHCYWGFTAQRLNHCFDNKLPLSKSAGIFLRQFLVDGVARGDISYAMLVFRLHWFIARAWIDSGRAFRGKSFGGEGRLDKTGWEGHGAPGKGSEGP